jgi:Reverse transcriptase (RNA-dependent DNA polymerase)
MAAANAHLFWPYRLAKFEVTAERRGVGRLAFGRFEQDLLSGLTALNESGVTPDRIFRNISPGNVWVRPKSVDRSRPKADRGRFVSVPEATHDHQITGMAVRVLLEPTPQFATSEVLWLLKFSAALEAVLSPQCMGNRLDLRGEPVSISVSGRRVYRYWAPAYRDFRQSALALAKRSLLTAGRRCVLVVLDLAAYYDNIDPSFLIDSEFVNEVQVTASIQNIEFNRNEYLAATEGLLDAFRRFRSAVEAAIGVAPRLGIPIGALTSRLIANLALVELDRYVPSRPGVCHYARYVDDILVVRESEAGPEGSPNDLVAELLPLNETRRSRRAFVLDEVRLRRSGSNFTIQPAKLRVFALEGEQGLEYLSAVEAEMDRVSSERRRFLEPWTSETDQTVAASPSEEPIRALRQADALRLRKLAVGTTCEKVMTAAAMLSYEEASQFSRTYLGKAGRLATDWSQWVDLLDVSLRILGAALLAGDRATADDAGT